MQERTIGSNPSEKQLDQLIQGLRDIRNALGDYLVSLTPKERRNRLKSRVGGTRAAAVIKRVATDRKIQVTGVSVADIELQQQRSERLAPLQAEATALARTIRDTMLDSESKAWWGTTALYTALQGAARSDGALKEALAPATAFFAVGRRKPKVTVPR
jgi:hypothetical protein